MSIAREIAAYILLFALTVAGALVFDFLVFHLWPVFWYFFRFAWGASDVVGWACIMIPLCCILVYVFPDAFVHRRR